MDLKVADLPGVGWSKVAQLEACNIETVRDVCARSQAFLQQELGSKVGASLNFLGIGIHMAAQNLYSNKGSAVQSRLESSNFRKELGQRVLHSYYMLNCITHKLSAM